MLEIVKIVCIKTEESKRSLFTGYVSFAASEITIDEIAAKNWPPLQRADILNRRLAFRRFKFMPPRKSPPPITLQCCKLGLYTAGM